MKPRIDLKPDDSVVLSSPNDYYVDPVGSVNELEDDAERILFGTVDQLRPSPDVFVVDWAPEADHLANDAESRLGAECERDIKRAMNPETNPHLMAMNTIFNSLGINFELGSQRPKGASILPTVEEEEDE